ncbi:hypothetical protein ACFLWZ_06230 [Chloroflexota bacterium]
MSTKKEIITAKQTKSRWFIDPNWYEQNNRSLDFLAQGYLCPECTKQLKEKGKETSLSKLLSNIKDCCSHAPSYITEQSPILESIFRIFLANGTQPLDLDELGKQLSECRGRGIYRTSTEALSRLLETDQYYGLRQIQG